MNSTNMLLVGKAQAKIVRADKRNSNSSSLIVFCFDLFNFIQENNYE